MVPHVEVLSKSDFVICNITSKWWGNFKNCWFKLPTRMDRGGRERDELDSRPLPGPNKQVGGVSTLNCKNLFGI